MPQGLGLDASVTRLQNVGPAFAKKLQRLGVNTVGDLLYLYPRRYDDYSKLKTISQLMYGEEVTLLLTVGEANALFAAKKEEYYTKEDGGRTADGKNTRVANAVGKVQYSVTKEHY